MNESPAFMLRWRGRQFGPCTLNEINRKLDDHEIGMGHEVQYQNRWISLEEFLGAQKSPAKHPAAVTPPPASPGEGEVPPPNDPVAGSTAVAPDRITPPSRPAPPPAWSAPGAPAPARPRRRWVYAVLAVLLGFSGLHNFYARHWLTGVIQLLISLASSLLGFGIIAPWIWAMLEAVFVHQDGAEMEML